MGNRLATTDIGRKEGTAVSLYGGRAAPAGPHLTQCGLGRDLPPYQSGILIHPAVWPQQTWAEKSAELCPFLRELDPHLTTSPGLRPTSESTGILILEPCSRLTTIQGPKLGGAAVPPFWGERRYLVNTTEPSVCGGDAALCQITLTTCWNNCPTFGLVPTYRLLNLYVSRKRYTSLAQTGHQYKLPRL